MRRSAILMVVLVGVCGCSDDNRGRGLRPLSFAVNQNRGQKERMYAKRSFSNLA